jgi:LPS sulfotransferase NodH
MAELVNPRLKIFPAPQVAKYRRDVEPIETAPWPEIAGCLTALCTPRSGSTLLCRQFETLFEVGKMGETLNLARLRERSAREIVSSRLEPWFSFKCAVPALVRVEHLGFFDAYLERTAFVHLIRRDIVSQAVSYSKAEQTGQWHAHRKPPGNPVYDAREIAASIRSIAVEVDQMRRYARGTGRPHTQLLYEEIAEGVAAAKAAGDLLGLPVRKSDSDGELLRPIEKMGDEVNEEWVERFLREMNASVGRIVEEYVAAVDLGAAPSWAESKKGPARKVLRTALRREAQFDAVLTRFPAETASLVRAAVDTLRTSFPSGYCLIVDEIDKSRLTIRFGADRLVMDAIFTVRTYPDGKVKIFFESDNPSIDFGDLVKGKHGKRYLTIKDRSSLARSDVAALFQQAVANARTPLPASGQGEIIIEQKNKKSDKWFEPGEAA